MKAIRSFIKISAIVLACIIDSIIYTRIRILEYNRFEIICRNVFYDNVRNSDTAVFDK